MTRPLSFFLETSPHGLSGHSVYLHIRDNPDFAQERAAIEALWTQFEGLEDPHFRIEAAKSYESFCQRIWEMTVAGALRATRHNLSTHGGDGPDLKESFGDKTIHIECISPTAGQGANTALPVPRDDADIIDVLGVPDYRLLKALASKAGKFHRYIKRGIVAANDPTVIAVNDFLIESASFDSGVPRIARVCHGLLGWNLERGLHGAPQRRSLVWRTELTNKNGNSVRSQLFFDDAFAHISAVIHEHRSPQQIRHPLGSGFMVLLNPNASNPLPPDWANFGHLFVPPHDSPPPNDRSPP